MDLVGFIFQKELSLNAMTLNRYTKNKGLASVNASLMLTLMNVAFPWIASFILCHKVVEGLRLGDAGF